VNALSAALLAAIATTLTLAAVGKLLAPAVARDYMVAIAEVGLVVWLVSGVLTVMSAMAAVALSAGYVVYAFRPKAQECSCFGTGLPRTSVAGQRYRNLALLTVAVGYAVLASYPAAQAHLTDTSFIGVVAGTLCGISLVSMPWLVHWLQPDRTMRFSRR